MSADEDLQPVPARERAIETTRLLRELKRAQVAVAADRRQAVLELHETMTFRRSASCWE
jgi:hypothetical protein